MRIAVIGGGIFGCTAAIHAARAEHEVHLFEKSDKLMQAASAVNQFRLHRGYHYPRSMETGRQCRKGNWSFHSEYREAIIAPELRKRGGQHYAIAREGSKVSGAEYIRFLKASRLPHRVVSASVAGLDPDSVETVVEVMEAAIDPPALQRIVEEKIAQSGVVVHFGTDPRTPPSRDDFDQIVIAAYANTNVVARQLGCKTTPLQFEVCEKPVVRLPDRFRDLSLVVMDGPFCSIDPYGKTGNHVLGHVVHAIHHTKTGDSAFDEMRTGPERGGSLKGPACLAPSIEMNAGILANPEVTRINAMIEAGSQFFPALRKAQHIGSMFTVRAVLPNKDATDERPTLVERLDDQVVRIFSGKIGTAVDAAYEALFMIERERLAA